ncbi:MAG: GGDEF domain-containing protein [Rhodocyclaceae bacterium]
MNPVNLLAITALLGGMMLFVLYSLRRSGLPGVREFLRGNVLALAGLVLIVLRGVIGDWASIVLGNMVLTAGTIESVIGCRLFFGLRTYRVLYWVTLVVYGASLAWFNYVVPSYAARVALASLFHAVLSTVIAVTVARHRPRHRPAYSYLFTVGLTSFFALGYLVRTVYYGWVNDPSTASLMAPGMNMVLLTIGAIVIPALAMCMVMMAHDEMIARAERAANTDFLTGVLSRRAFTEALEREIIRATRTGRPLCLVMTDIDHFKAINDSHGHAAGDEVLRHFSSVGMSIVRASDCFGRMGGEEFALLLPDTTPAAAEGIAERLVAHAREHIVHAEGQVIRFTVSAGVAQWQSGAAASMLAAAADDALYKAKNAGRDRVALQHPSWRPAPAWETGRH